MTLVQKECTVQISAVGISDNCARRRCRKDASESSLIRSISASRSRSSRLNRFKAAERRFRSKSTAVRNPFSFKASTITAAGSQPRLRTFERFPGTGTKTKESRLFSSTNAAKEAKNLLAGIRRKYGEDLDAAIADEKAEMLVIAAATEADIAELESYEERQMFLEDLGLEESGVARLIKAAYKLLNLETFFTTGADETRAWTYSRGMKAPQTAGIIHTDFERGFIRAEVIKYDDYVTLGSEKACRDAGKIGIEGKEYVVQDGDIMHFLFNV